MASNTSIVNINKNTTFGSKINDNDINILSSDSAILLNAIIDGNSYNKTKILIKKKIQNEKIHNIANKSNDYQKLHELIISEDFPKKMENENFCLYIIYHPLLNHHPEYTNILTKYKQIEIENIKSKMKDNTSHKIPINIEYIIEGDASLEEDDYSEDI
jgi:hypothetical protein